MNDIEKNALAKIKGQNKSLAKKLCLNKYKIIKLEQLTQAKNYRVVYSIGINWINPLSYIMIITGMIIACWDGGIKEVVTDLGSNTYSETIKLEVED